MHVEFHKVIKLIKNYKIYEIFVKIENRRLYAFVLFSGQFSDIFVEIEFLHT